MKKGIEWLKDKIRSERECLALSLSKGQETMREYNFNNGKHGALVDVLKLIDQLDEPEVTLNRAFEKVSEIYPMTKEEVCRHLEQVVAHGGKVTYDEQEVLSQELPVIPKYVADFIKVRKYTDAYSLQYIFCIAMQRSEDERLKKEYDWISANDETFATAWLSGYEVEEEPMYQALIKGHEVADGYDIYWNCDKSDCGVFVSRLHPLDDNFITEMNKEAWNELGIDDSNADFVKVEELEE